jgi:hypothetical protein
MGSRPSSWWRFESEDEAPRVGDLGGKSSAFGAPQGSAISFAARRERGRDDPRASRSQVQVRLLLRRRRGLFERGTEGSNPASSDIQNCVCIGRRSNMREYGRGSYPGDRREARPGIKRIGSLTPGGERFGHLLQLFLRRPALRDRQLAACSIGVMSVAAVTGTCAIMPRRSLRAAWRRSRPSSQ